MSSFRKFSREEFKNTDGIISVNKDRDKIITQNRIKYRRADADGLNCQDSIYHYIFDLKDCRKIYYNNKWYYEIKPHKCFYNCQDSKQTDKEWLNLLRYTPNTDMQKRRVRQMMQKYGYTNTQKEGYSKVG